MNREPICDVLSGFGDDDVEDDDSLASLQYLTALDVSFEDGGDGLVNLVLPELVSDAARDPFGVEMFEKRKHGAPAGSHPVAKLRDRDGATARDDLSDHRRRRPKRRPS